ncbi:MAG: hypothetical protein AABY07_04360 [Nanoarchaeota archaeon]
MEGTITCPKCNSKISVKELRADKSGTQWICVGCYSRQHLKEPKKESRVTEKLKEWHSERTAKPAVTEQPVSKESKIKKLSSFKCTSCNYKFESSVFTLDKMCPFCSRKGNIERVKTASEILREIDDIPDFS